MDATHDSTIRDFLRNVPFLSKMPDEDFQRVCMMVIEVKLPAGKVLFEEGTIGDRAYVLQEGQVEILKVSRGRQVLIALRGPGSVLGEISLLERAERTATVRAHSDVTLLELSREQFEQLINTSPSASRAILETILGRWRETDAQLMQSEKMAQLGTMTAGVAHEINNPVAAVQRGSGQLADAAEEFAAARLRVSEAGLDAQQLAMLDKLIARARDNAAHPPEMDALARSDLEYELESWLEDHNVEDAWEVAPVLSSLNYGPDDLTILVDHFAAEQLTPIVAVLSATYSLYNLLAEINRGSERIAEIVKALKSYSYLDQAPVQNVNVHEGINNTLLILQNKLKSGVNVRREYDPDLPEIEAYGSELNQVWTNIIDNAIDAVEGKGEITIRTRRVDDCWIVVEIEDNGPGIPDEIKHRIFDSFFTTKPPGKGTGIGLDISYRIVVFKHQGDIKVFSKPGMTRFQVWLPSSFEKAKGTPLPMGSYQQPDDAEIRQIVTESKTIAVVGISGDESKPGYTVPAYLREVGYRIVPVNPNLDEWLGVPAYAELTDVPEPVDVVLIFRRNEAVPAIVDQAVEIGARTVWMQEGVVNERAAETAKSSGLHVVMDSCIRVQHLMMAKEAGLNQTS